MNKIILNPKIKASKFAVNHNKTKCIGILHKLVICYKI